MKLTEVRCYVLACMVAERKLVVERNGALEPSIKNCYVGGAVVHPFSEKRMLTAVADLQREGFIRFREHGLHGVYKGLAELTRLGRQWLPMACAKLDEFAELKERQAAERAAFERKRAEEIAAFEVANQVLKSDEDDEDPFVAQRIAAADRVREFLITYQQVPGVNLATAAIVQKVDGKILQLDTADLLLLCDIAGGRR